MKLHTLLAFFAAALPVSAQGPLTIATGRGDKTFALSGRDTWQQLLVSAPDAKGQLQDVTRKVAYTIQPGGIAAVDATGLVTPLKEGQATITAQSSSATASIQVQVTNQVQDVPVHFANQIVPIFSRFNCNGGGCHGKAGGQNGFRLSLLGFEPEDDYEYLVKENRGRRLDFSAPDHSILLRKASGSMPHGGGRLIDLNSAYYRILRRWVDQGAPFGKASDPVVTHIEVHPSQRTLERNGEQQLAVIAHLSDKTTVDVTRMTQFETNHEELAGVSSNGLVAAKGKPGSVAVMARFQTHVGVFQAVIPQGAAVAQLPPARNFIDELVAKNWKKLGLPPSPVADDGVLLRRVTVDIAGRLPTLAETEKFLADKSPDKLDRWIDHLLAGPDYAYHFAGKWSAILRNRRKTDKDDGKPNHLFYGWIKSSLDTNKPYDQFVREILTASGSYEETPTVVWYREVSDWGQQVEDASQLFLGQRIACAKCHHHPLEKWSQEDYFGMAAFFQRVSLKETAPKKGDKKKEEKDTPLKIEMSVRPGAAQASHPRTNKPVSARGLGSAPVNAGQDDPRPMLVDWMIEKDNPFFARALVNRYWKHFFGKGLVDPEDDLRITNPPSNPELLDALAAHFTAQKFDLKKLVKTIVSSNVYRLTSLANADNSTDKQNFSHFLPRRLNAEVLLDSIDDVTEIRTNFKGVPGGTRAVQLPDNQSDSYFLSVFGRPESASACECERSSDSSLAQLLHTLNSRDIQAKIAKGRGSKLAKDKRPHEDKVKELYLIAFSRAPNAAEMKNVMAYLERAENVQVGYEDLVWALINTKEFLYNH